MAQTPTGVPQTDWGEQTGRGYPKKRRGFFRAIWDFFWGIIRLILATTVFFAILVVASYQVIGHYIRGNPTQAPDLTARSVTEALEDLDKYKLSLVLDGWEASDAVQAGEIIKQNPKPGAWIKDRTAIKVTVSTGPKNEVIPNTLVGVSRREAGLRLRELNLGVSHVAYVRIPGKPNEEVVATDPPVGTGVPPNSSIKLLVASDRPGIQSLIPDLNGLTVDLAREELRRIGLPAPKVGVVGNDKAQPGTVYRQVPEAGETIRDSALVVDLTVAPMKTPDPSPTPGPAVGDLDLYPDKKAPAPEGAPAPAGGSKTSEAPGAKPADKPADKPTDKPGAKPGEKTPGKPSWESEKAPNAPPAAPGAGETSPAKPSPQPVTPGDLDQTEDQAGAKGAAGRGLSSSHPVGPERPVPPGERAFGPLRFLRGVDPYPEATLPPEAIAAKTPPRPPPEDRIPPELRELAREVERRARGLATPTDEFAEKDPVRELEEIVGMASERLKAMGKPRAGPPPESEADESPPPKRRARPSPTPDRPPPRTPESDAAQAISRIRSRSPAASSSGRPRSQDRPRSRSDSRSRSDDASSPDPSIERSSENDNAPFIDEIKPGEFGR